MNPKQFWMVWNPLGSAPTFMHDSEMKASQEAERLARMNPGKCFYVLEAVGARMVNDMQRVSLRSPWCDPPARQGSMMGQVNNASAY